MLKQHARRVATSAVTAYLLMFSLFFVSLQVTHNADRRDARRIAHAVHVADQRDARRAVELVRRADLRDLRRNCLLVRHEWDTFQHLIHSATHPPSLAGETISPAQRAALDAYQTALIGSIGPRPSC